MEDYIKGKCKCCGGTGTQYNEKTGLRQPCPYCNGTGEEKPRVSFSIYK